MITFFLKGNPKPKQRPRISQPNPRMRPKIYSPASQWETDILKQLKIIKMRNSLYYDKAIEVDCIFLIPRPKSHFRTGKYSHLLKPTAPIYHEVKGDRDNYDKCILDRMTKAGILKDDCIVIGGYVGKKWAHGVSGCFVRIKELY